MTFNIEDYEIIDPPEEEYFITEYDDTQSFPFFEDDRCNITAFGHWDKKKLAEYINFYDEYTTGDEFDSHWKARDISHKWAVRFVTENGDVGIWAHEIGPDTPKSFKISTLWGQR